MSVVHLAVFVLNQWNALLYDRAADNGPGEH